MKYLKTILVSTSVVLIMIILCADAARGLCNSSLKPTVHCMYTDSKNSILDERHLRVFNGQMSVSPGREDVFGFSNPLAPPFVTTNFHMKMYVDGEMLAPDLFYWKVSDIDRSNSGPEYKIMSSLTMSPMGEAFVVVVQFANMKGFEESTEMDSDEVLDPSGEGEVRVFDLRFSISGNLKKAKPSEWDIVGPMAFDPVEVSFNEEKSILSAVNSDGGLYCRTNMPDPIMKNGDLSTKLSVSIWKSEVFHFVCVLGTEKDSWRILNWYDGPLQKTKETYQNTHLRVSKLFERMPYVLTDNYELRSFYDHSAASLLVSKWELPDKFVASPYFSSGGIDGSAFGAYLQDFGPISGIMPLVNPDSAARHIGLLVNMNPLRYGGFEPDTGMSVGMRNASNKYHIVKMIYDYISITGERGILENRYGGPRLMDYLVKIADGNLGTLDMPDLVAYEKIETRGREGYLPDLNARRVWTYRAVADLVEISGKEQQWVEILRSKADRLAALIDEKLWNEDAGWYDTVSVDGERETIFDERVYDIMETGVVSGAQAAAMVAHLNEKEFLDEFGLRGIVADTPGGGDDESGRMVRVVEAPKLIENLYRAGFYSQAEDVFSRILWWGEKFPYYPEYVGTSTQTYGDFGRANSITGAAGAQAIIFGVFGLRVSLKGEVSISPRPLNMANELIVDNIIIRERKIKLALYPDRCEVYVSGQRLDDAPIGERTVVVPGAEFPEEEEELPGKCFESERIMNE